jgi:hypothetical protein
MQNGWISSGSDQTKEISETSLTSANRHGLRLTFGSQAKTSGYVYPLWLTTTYNQTNPAAVLTNIDFLITRTNTATTGSGPQLLADWRADGQSKFSVDTNGNLTVNGGVYLGTSTNAPFIAAIGTTNMSFTVGAQTIRFSELWTHLHP